MQFSPEKPITPAELRASTVTFGILAIAISLPLIALYPRLLLLPSWVELASAAGIFWGILSLFAFGAFWDIYYRYIYPPWLRRFAPINIILYGFIGFTIWSISQHYSIQPVILFLILGGLEGVFEHILGIYGLDILEKVPWLEGLAPFPILIFSFLEYIVYWSLVAWLALGIRLIT